MTRNNNTERDQLEVIAIDQLVPQDHLVRKIESAIDFSFIYPLVEKLYSTLGRPSIDPVVLIKMTFIQYVFGIRSMRQTIKEIETNVAYRWFLGFGFYTEVPHFSTFGKNYERRFKETDLFEQIFYRILKEITDKG
ncbi:transposase, partial [Metabacillus niabensis]|nr:transposase [Metabacillus niabensis]